MSASCMAKETFYMALLSWAGSGATPNKSFSKSPRPRWKGFFMRFIMADLTFTTIEEAARHALNISRDEYAACNYIQTWSAFPSNNTPGFCNRTRGQMALFIGISERGMQKMLSRLEGMNLIKRASENQFLYRITEKWFEVVVAAKEQRTGEQSSRQGVNKVPGGGEQSSRQGVNKVPAHKELNKEVYKTTTKEKFDVAVFDNEVNALIIDSIPVEAEKEKDTPLFRAAPLEKEKELARPTPGESGPAMRWLAFDIDKEAFDLKTDELAFEMYARQSGNKRQDLFELAIELFTLDQKATGYNYDNRIDFRKHFFNLVRRKAEIARNNQPSNQAQVRNGNGQKANINNLGSNPERYAETPLF